MRTALTVSLVLLVSVSIYIFTSGSAYEKNTVKQTQTLLTVPGGDKFIIGAFNSGWDVNYKYAHDTLGFNLWRIYNC